MADRQEQPDGGSALSQLKQVRILGGRMTLTDEASGTVWRAPSAFLNLERIPRGLSAQLNVSVDIKGSYSVVDADLVFDRETGLLDAAIDFSGLRLPALYEALNDPDLIRLTDFDTTISGRIVGQMSTLGLLKTAAVDLEAAPGRLTLPDLEIASLPFRKFEIGAGFDLAAGKVNLRQLELALGEESGPTLTASGSLEGLRHDLFRPQQDDLVVDVAFALDRLPARDLKLFRSRKAKAANG